MRFPKWGLWLSATLVLMAGSSVGTWYWLTQVEPGVRIPASMRNNKEFAQFVQTYQLIRSKTIWSNSPHQLLVGAINGMVGTLHDQFSNYLSPSSTKNFNALLNPTFTGIGIEVEPEAHDLRIMQVFSHSPAALAGLKPGELIVDVNHTSVASMNPIQALSRIRGPVNTYVTLTVEDHNQLQTHRIERERIALPTVFSQMMPHHIAYMNITEFGNNTGQEATQQWHQLLRQGARGLLLDLRNNPGGEVSQALQVANLFVPKGPVVTLKFKNPAQDQTLNSDGPGTSVPIVVLVNGQTASAAEILSAAIQERQGGLLVGTRTYGKGIVQQVLSLPGHAALKLTVARYYTPNGQYIEHVGLTPNVYDPEPIDVVPSNNPKQDPQLQKAITVLLQHMAHR
ncbi:MAG: S41 family peptidase [Sulfobacillus thermosulfidooxidans]|uniref:S41 family peptidase n=1 Tax=Sulfobacillus thermosulfidooxidans TaxID=28034 RepID=A0A2T2WYC6_SULTH|nr:MAG: S41 family peptidase [Sulfobacillus thermosulfidooxidans]